MVVKTVPLEILSHKRLVCSLYKRCARMVESYIYTPHGIRFNQCLVRARFDEQKKVADPVKAKIILEEGEKELWQRRHYSPIVWFESPDGIAYERDFEHQDNVLDYWHPLEKGMYPEYFARREQRKKEYIEWYTKKYGKPTAEELGHH